MSLRKYSSNILQFLSLICSKIVGCRRSRTHASCSKQVSLIMFQCLHCCICSLSSGANCGTWNHWEHGNHRNHYVLTSPAAFLDTTKMVAPVSLSYVKCHHVLRQLVFFARKNRFILVGMVRNSLLRLSKLCLKTGRRRLCVPTVQLDYSSHSCNRDWTDCVPAPALLWKRNLFNHFCLDVSSHILL